MKILLLTNRVPYPLNDGGAKAMYASLSGYLQAGQEVSLLSFNTSKHFVEPAELPDLFKSLKNLILVPLDNRIRWTSLGYSLITRQAIHFSRFRQKAFGKSLKSLLERSGFDIVQVEGLQLSHYLPVVRKYSQAKLVLRAHNIEHEIWGPYARALKNPLNKIFLNLMTARLKKEEQRYASRYDAILPMSADDAVFFRHISPATPIRIFPYGVERISLEEGTERFPEKIYFLGALEWLPNLQGLEWFLSEVWPVLHARMPGLKFQVAGKKMPDSLFKSVPEGVFLSGEVADAFAFCRDMQVMVAPLLAGSGLRVKVLEALSWGKTVVCTPQAIRGMGTKDGEHLLQGDSPESVAEKLEWCFTHPGLARVIGRHGKQFVKDHYLNPKLISENLAFFTVLTGQKSPGEPPIPA